MMIEGGTGNGYRAGVSSENRLKADCVTNKLAAQVTLSHAGTFSWAAATADLGADENIIWLRNDDPNEILFIDGIVVGTLALADVEIYISEGSAVAGAAIVGVNLRPGSGRVALATCRSANTNVDAGAGSTLLATGYCNGNLHRPVEGKLALGYLQEVSINIVTDVGGCNATITGFYHVAD